MEGGDWEEYEVPDAFSGKKDSGSKSKGGGKQKNNNKK